MQVMDKFGGQVGQDKVRTLLGMSEASTNFAVEEEKSNDGFIKQM